MPRIELDHCIKCMKCVKDCPSDAIDIDSGTIDDTCIHCGHCVAICPESTIYPDYGDIMELQPDLVSLTISGSCPQISEPADLLRTGNWTMKH